MDNSLFDQHNFRCVKLGDMVPVCGSRRRDETLGKGVPIPGWTEGTDLSIISTHILKARVRKKLDLDYDSKMTNEILAVTDGYLTEEERLILELAGRKLAQICILPFTVHHRTSGLPRDSPGATLPVLPIAL